MNLSCFAARVSTIAVLLLSAATGCGGPAGGDATAGIALTVNPEEAHIAASAGASFAATVTGVADTGVTWSIQEGSAGGTISPAGDYVAPSQAGTFHVVATSNADPSVSRAAVVTVSITAPAPAPPPAPVAGSCAAEPLRGTGTIYYYCDCGAGAAAGCAAGDDAAAGTSASAPRRSFANAASRFGTMSAGDTIAFCRGGAWSTTGATWANPACRAGATCDVRDYVPSWSSASAARPLFVASSGDTFNLNRSGHEEGYRFLNLAVRGGRWGFFLYSDVGEVEICNVSIDGAQIAVHQGGGAVGQARNGRLIVRDCTISNSVEQGVLGAANGLTIDRNVFVDNGVSTKFYHPIYIEGESIPGSSPLDAYETFGVRVTNNVLLQTTTCLGAVVVAHGRHNGLTIENNVVEARGAAPECYGIGVGHGDYPYGSWFRNTSIQRNRVILAGGRVGIALNASTNSRISDNLVTLTAQYADGIVVPDNPNNGGDVNTGTVIQNNTIRSTHGNIDYGVWVRSYEGADYVVENNAVFFDSSANPCITLARPTLRNANNYCRQTGGAALASVFVDAPNGNYKPADPGPLIGTGNATWFSPIAIGTISWSMEDPGTIRVGAIDIGAFTR